MHVLSFNLIALNMRKFLFAFTVAVAVLVSQDAYFGSSFLMPLLSFPAGPDISPDSIVGAYSAIHKGETTKIRITKAGDGTYTAQVYWVQNRTGKDGKVRKDEKNPDKSLRNVDCDKIILIKGLRYNHEKGQWDGAKIYDPTRGLNANVKVVWKDAKTLALTGSKAGLSETVLWTRIGD